MSLLRSSFGAALLLATGPTGGRALQRDEAVVRLEGANLEPALAVYDAALGRRARRAATLGQRWTRGLRGYCLLKAGAPATVLWVARVFYDVFPLRLRVDLEESSAMIFDEATVPGLRRQGLLGALIRQVWEEERWETVGCCIREDNADSLAANGRIGFQRSHDVTLEHLGGVIRRHGVRAAASSVERVFWSLATVWENRRRLGATLTAGGYGRFRLTLASDPLAQRKISRDIHQGQ